MNGPMLGGALEKQYDVIGPIGQGQYGTAYKVKSKADGHVYCLKRIPMGSRDDNAGALSEAQVLARLSHPNIIGYKESFLDGEGVLCIITSFCAEGDLATAIRRRAAAKAYFTEDEIMDVFIQVASALLYIHGLRVLHRDLKTQNIFLDRGGIVMLGDFGISKVLEKTDAFATTVTGTPYYMAPEVCTSQPYTYKSDIWSLGCVLYELCTLRHAFEADSLLSLVYQIVRGSYPPIPSDRYSSSLSDLVNQLLTREQEQRPSLAQVFTLPYVRQHLQRFNSQERTRLLQRRASLKTTQGPAPAPAAAAATAVSEEDLTPRQRMELKKEQERQRRQLELQVAAVNQTKDRQEAARRKAGQLHSTVNLGQPAGKSKAQSNPYQQLEEAAMTGTISNYMAGMSLGGPEAPAARPPQQQQQQRQMEYSSWQQQPQQPQQQQQQAYRAVTASITLSPGQPQQPYQQQQVYSNNSYDSRQINSTGVYDFAAAAAAEAAGDEGWLGSTTRTVNVSPAGFDTTASSHNPDHFGWAAQQQVAQQDWSSVSSPLGDTCSVLMGTMPAVAPSGGFHFGVQEQPLSGTMHPFDATMSGYNAAGGSSYVSGDNSNWGQQQGFAVGSPQQLNVMFEDKVRFGVQDNTSQPQPGFEYVFADCRVNQVCSNGVPAMAAGAAAGGYAGDEYEEDFETYEGEQQQQAYQQDSPHSQLAAAEVQQRMRILRNVNSISRYCASEADPAVQEEEDNWAASAAAAQEAVVRPTSAELQQVRATAESRIAMLRQRCQAALGPKWFGPVHEYLTEVRAGAEQQPIDENEVRQHLLTLVAGHKGALQGCFLVDQLVFEELMHASLHRQ